jgi:hypothetical protein
MTAEMASPAAMTPTPVTVVGVVCPKNPTLALKMSTATTAMTPTTAPQMPSKNAARN